MSATVPRSRHLSLGDPRARHAVCAWSAIGVVALGLSLCVPRSASAGPGADLEGVRGGPETEAERAAAALRADVGDFDLLDNDGCVDCHPAVAREWKGSLHRRAYTNDAFQASHAREPLPFCQTCHAPRANKFPAEPTAARDGIDCVTCHVKDGRLVAGPGPTPAASAPHTIERLPELGAPEGCGECHQFEFPRKAGRRPGALMQKTVDEHAGSDYSGMDCADCHMDAASRGPGRRRGSGHGFDVSRNPQFMRAALSTVARRPVPDRLDLTLEPNEVGHFFPTGDLFRRVEIRVEAVDPQGRPVFATTRYLARHFPAASAGRFFSDEPDDRLRGTTTFAFDLDGVSADDEVRWSVTYQRVGERDPAAPETSEVVGSIELGAGKL